MNAERWQQVKAVFEAAEALAAPERESFLDESCGADKDLRQAVENLLAA